MARIEDELREALAGQDPLPDMSRRSLDELRDYATRAYADVIHHETALGLVLAELRRREPRGRFAATCRAIGIPRRNAYRWSDRILAWSET